MTEPEVKIMENKETLTKFWAWLTLNHAGCRDINQLCNPVVEYLKELEGRTRKPEEF